MRKAKILAIVVLAMGLLGGCSKFSPNETAVLVGKDGAITAAIIDTLDESYYNSEELTKEVNRAVADYNKSTGAESITVETFEIEGNNVELFMKYAMALDYKAFNNVDFYVGDITNSYNEAGYRFETTFSEVDNGVVLRSEVEREEIFAGLNYSIIVFNEDMEVTVPGKILFISDNLELTGKKSARRVTKNTASESETQAAAQTESETEVQTEDNIMDIDPVVEEPAESEQGGVTQEQTENKSIAYIIYE